MALKVSEVAAAGYRSLRQIAFPVEPLSIFVGANGVGKTNLYRVLQLLQSAAAGTLATELAAEGGMAAASWAGKRLAGEPVQIRLRVGLGAAYGTVDYSYEVAIGLPGLHSREAFPHEPQVKDESATFHIGRRPAKLLERRGAMLRAIDENGSRIDLETRLLASETALARLEDPSRYPDLHLVRQTLLDWRFYHDLRTDRASPLRQPCLAVTSPTLASDGHNLAAVLATLVHIRQDTSDLDAVIDDAFPGAQLVVPEPGRMASFGLVFPEHPQRVFEAGELSDGTLRYLALAGALLSHRLPAFIALNEPEASLHPDLLEPLARLIGRAAQRTQVWLVTHSEPLAQALERQGGMAAHTVLKRAGETWIEGLNLIGQFAPSAEAHETIR